MGEVWQACDTKLDRFVALKLLPKINDQNRDDQLRRFETFKFCWN